MKRSTLINLILFLISVVIFAVFPPELALRIGSGIMSPLLCGRLFLDACKRARKKNEEPHQDQNQFYFDLAPSFFLSLGMLAFFYASSVLPDESFQYVDLSFWLFAVTVFLWLLFRAIADIRDRALQKKYAGQEDRLQEND